MWKKQASVVLRMEQLSCQFFNKLGRIEEIMTSHKDVGLFVCRIIQSTTPRLSF